MKKINLAITGCMGRMGRQIIKSAKSDKVFRLVSLTESKKLNKKINNIKITQNTIDSFKKADLIIGTIKLTNTGFISSNRRKIV